jgi:hypothetical protein
VRVALVTRCSNVCCDLLKCDSDLLTNVLNIDDWCDVDCDLADAGSHWVAPVFWLYLGVGTLTMVPCTGAGSTTGVVVGATVSPTVVSVVLGVSVMSLLLVRLLRQRFRLLSGIAG